MHVLVIYDHTLLSNLIGQSPMQLGLWKKMKWKRWMKKWNAEMKRNKLKCVLYLSSLVCVCGTPQHVYVSPRQNVNYNGTAMVVWVPAHLLWEEWPGKIASVLYDIYIIWSIYLSIYKTLWWLVNIIVCMTYTNVHVTFYIDISDDVNNHNKLSRTNAILQTIPLKVNGRVSRLSSLCHYNLQFALAKQRIWRVL